ncbi:hypothetical protein J7I94_18250 [Streptomyces sp. ISL-12]|uniref:hypothetical protein n=1 Tax=Streptomyces sp. ISL-12 TaxID=2819177 RepID=UPI001BE7DC7B|nr:hypothetical protein [Streptomyces sp. ISL-12]MBT2412479.1 hypothetical protein [Streptomyces sp. ISL-12]
MSFLDPEQEQQWLGRVADDPEFRLVSRWGSVCLTLLCDDESRTYQIENGRFTAEGGHCGKPYVVLAGSSAAWGDFTSPTPPRHSQHVLAMDRRRDDFEIREGRTELIRHLRVIDVVLQQMRAPAPGHQQGVLA